MYPLRFRFLLLFILFLGFDSANAQPYFSWVDAMPGFSTNALPDQTGAGQLFVDKKGHVYVLNNVNRGIDMDPGPGVDSIYIANTSGGTAMGKYDSMGHLIWAHTFGNAGAATCTISDSGYYYVAGQSGGIDSFGMGYTIDTSTISGFFVAKYDSLDHLVWVKVTASPGGDIYSMKVDHSGNVYVTGQFNGTTDFDPAHPGNLVFVPSLLDGFVAKYSADGSLVWARQIHGGDGDRGVSLDLDAAANVVVTGYTGGIATAYTPMMDTGNVFRHLNLNGGYDGFVVKYNTNGAILWMRTMGGNGHDYGYSVMVDHIGNVYTGGNYSTSMIADTASADTLVSNPGNSGGYLIKYSPNGNFLWAKNYGCDSGNSFYSNVISIAKDDTDNVYLTGAFMGKMHLNSSGLTMHANGGVVGPGQDCFVLKLDPMGNYKWSQHIFSKRDDVPAYIYLDGKNNIYVSGYVTDTTSFSLGGGSGLIAYPMPNPNWIPVSFVEKLKPYNNTTNVITVTNNQNISVFPNPAKNKLTLTGDINTSASVQVYDELGKLCNVPVLLSTGSAILNTEALVPGIYFLRYIEQGGTPYSATFIKE